MPTSNSTPGRSRPRRLIGALLRTVLAAASAATAFGHIINLNPFAVTAGGPAFTLIVNGIDFDESDIITWNNSELGRCAAIRVAPCYALISGIRMEVAVPASFIATPGAAVVGLVDFNSETLFINPRPAITTASPLPNATAGTAYATSLNATGGTTPLRWSISAGALPPGLLFDTGGRITGTPTTPGTSTFTVVVTDSLQAADTKAFSLTVGSTPVTGVSCALTPQNSFLGMHRPEWHTNPGRVRNPDHLLYVDVIADGSPARSLPLTITASQAAFQDSSTSFRTTANATTDATGRATFVINPPAPQTFDQTNFEASGSHNGRTFRCNGSAVTGVGTLGPLALESVITTRPASVLSGIAQTALAPLLSLGNLFGSGPRSRVPPADLRPLPPFRPQTNEQIRQLLQHLKGNLMQVSPPSAPPAAGDRAAAIEKLNSLPLRFESHRGEILARADGYDVAAAPGEIRLTANSKPESTPPVRVLFAGVNRAARVSVGEELPGVSHYLRGADPTVWRSNVRQYADVVYRDAYPGIDVVLHGRRRNLELDFVVAPGADPSAIVLQFEGAARVERNPAGDLILRTPSQTMRLERPFVYQGSGIRRPTRGEYAIVGKNRVAFKLGSYDPTRPLVIDPVISFAGFLGGSGTEAAAAIAVDPQGNIYIAGGTNSPDFPSAGPFQRFSGVGPLSDVFVTKLDPTGARILYSTFVGGLGPDAAFGIAVDAAGSAYVTGNTGSPNFPVKNPLQATLRNSSTSVTDSFVFKLNPAGSDLVYSTYLGGSGDDLSRAIAVDSAGSAIVAGSTFSPDFPLRNPVQSAYRGTGPISTNAFVARLNSSGSDLIYSTYLGGADLDMATAVAVDSAGNAYVTGVATSTAFPTAAPFQANNRGGHDAFLTKLTPAGALVYSTFLGGQGDDAASGVAVDSSGNAYVTGVTGSTNFPSVQAVQPRFGSTAAVGMDAFVAKFAANGASLVYSTFLGGSGIDMGTAIAVGADGSAYVTGETTSADFPAVAALQRNRTGSSYAFIAKLNPAASAFVYSTTLGGTGPDSATGLAVHPSGVYIAGTTRSHNFPATYGSIQPGLRGNSDATVVKLVDVGAPTPAFSSLHGATFLNSTGSAPEAIAAGFGENLAPSVASAASGDLPTSLANVSVLIKDKAGREVPAPLFFVSPGQINYLVPAGLAAGLAAISVRNGFLSVAEGTLRIGAIAPGLFSANANGQGVAAALALKVAADGTQSAKLVFTCGPAAGSCVPDPIDLGGPTDRIYLLLFGTGLRGRSVLTGVTAVIGGENLGILSAGAQGEFPGLDQVNIGPLPRTLAGRGPLAILLAVDGEQSNVVTVAIK